MMKRAVLTSAMLALVLATLGAAVTTAPAHASSESDAAQSPSFISLQGLDIRPLSHEEMQRVTGQALPGLPLDLTALIERLDPAAKIRLTDLLISAQARGIPLPPALATLIPNRGGVDGQGTEAQGIETH